MLEVRGVAAGYGTARALDDVSLRVDDGEIVTILGPNGAGKTTLVNVIAGIARPWSGSVEFDGTTLSSIAAQKVSEKGIAIVPEGRRIFPAMTVSDNLAIGSYHASARRDHDATLAWVEEIFPRLAERRRQLAGSLSGGEQQMVAVGRALMAKPKLLLLDEPSLGLAPIIVQSIFGVLRQLNETGLSILLVEQNAVEALRLAGRGYVLEEGRIVTEGAADDLLADERLRKAYLGL